MTSLNADTWRGLIHQYILFVYEKEGIKKPFYLLYHLISFCWARLVVLKKKKRKTKNSLKADVLVSASVSVSLFLQK